MPQYIVHIGQTRLLPSLNHNDMVTEPRFHLSIFGVASRTWLQFIGRFLKSRIQASSNLPSKGPSYYIKSIRVNLVCKNQLATRAEEEELDKRDRVEPTLSGLIFREFPCDVVKFGSGLYLL